MIGLSILLAVVVYVWLARFITKHIANRAAKYAVIAVFVLIPTWDVIPGKLYFNHLCENEAGLKIFKVVEGVEGFRVYPLASGLGREALTKYGYKFEERGSGSSFARYTLDASGKVIEQKITESMARYAAEGKLLPLRWNVTKAEIVVFDQQTKERLAVWTTFSTKGNWLQAFFNPLLGGHAPCEGEVLEKDLYLLTLKPTLKPTKSTN